MTMQNKQTAQRCEPSEPAPEPQAKEPCTGQLTGEITGTVTMDCCCPRLHTRTFIINIGPQTEAQLLQYTQNTVTAYEGSGYMILGHSLLDVGAGWVLGLTIGWYQ